jgi:predicted HicB family RNase H-like nuclease
MPDFDPYAYAISIQRSEVDGEAVFVARVSELPHVEVFESTPAMALEVAAETVAALFDASKEEGRVVPQPVDRATTPTGRFTLRMPPWLQGRLQQAAEAEGQSLNTHICNVLIAHQTADSVIEAARATVHQAQASPASLDFIWGHLEVLPPLHGSRPREYGTATTSYPHLKVQSFR